MLKTTWSRRLPMYLPTSDFFRASLWLLSCSPLARSGGKQALNSPLESRALRHFLRSASWPLSNARPPCPGYDAQTPATIQYDHLAAPLFQHRYICLELRLFGAEILDLVKLPRQRSIR